jgi:hypothetical protein
LLLSHAFDGLVCKVVGLRTDNFNFASQQAIEALGAKKDGVIRHHALRREGTVRDTVIYSILVGEWPDVKAALRVVPKPPFKGKRLTIAVRMSYRRYLADLRPRQYRFDQNDREGDLTCRAIPMLIRARIRSG